MDYKINLIDKAEREARIKRGLESPSASETFYDFRNTKMELKVIRIPIDLPIYRMENFRTFSEQSNFITREKKSPEYFTTGQENESVQQVQHEILARLAEKGKASSVVPIIDVLQREGQRDNLLITASGVVVNGNRRLAAMRELLARDSSTNADFNHVNCVVLPSDATPNDILEIEAILQGRPETRLDYDWVGDAQLVLALLRMKNGRPEDAAKILRRKTAEVKNVLKAFSEADLYLNDWANAKNEYSRVSESGEQFFNDLPGALDGKPEALKDASRAIAWTLFENSPKLPGRLYNYNVVFGKQADVVMNQLSEDMGISLSSETSTGGAGSFDFDMGEESGQTNYQPLIDILKSKNKEAIETLLEISVNVVESEKDKKSGEAALKAITVANSKLAEVDLSRANPETHISIKRQLEAIIQRATNLRQEVDKSISINQDKTGTAGAKP